LFVVVSYIPKATVQAAIAGVPLVAMRAAGMDVPPFKVAKNIGEAVEAAGEIGYPVVMKVVSEDIVHKTDIGGVLLDIDNEKEVVEGYEAILRNCRQYAPKANIRGVEIAKMVPKGMEIFTT
jgi:acyl-CoA synthetase (NDP forming)